MLRSKPVSGDIQLQSPIEYNEKVDEEDEKREKLPLTEAIKVLRVRLDIHCLAFIT